MFATYTVQLLKAGKPAGARQVASRRTAERAAEVAVLNDLADTALVLSGQHVVATVTA